MDPPEKYPIIAVSAGLRWLTEVVTWKRGSGFVYWVAAAFLHQKNRSSPKIENYSIYLLSVDRGVVLVDQVTGHVTARTVSWQVSKSLRWRYCADIDGWFGMKIYFRIDKEIGPLRNNTFFQRRQSRAVTRPRKLNSRFSLVVWSKLKIVTIQWIKSRIRNTIDDWYINNLAKKQVSAVFHSCVICRSAV